MITTHYIARQYNVTEVPEATLCNRSMEVSAWFPKVVRFLLFIAWVIGFSCLAYVCAWIIELPFLKYFLGLPYEFRVITLTPIVEESLKVLPFLMTVYLFRRYWGIEITQYVVIAMLFFIGAGFGFLEGVISHHATGLYYLVPHMLAHGSMTGWAGFFPTGIFVAIFLHVITNSIPNAFYHIWKGLVIFSFSFGVLVIRKILRDKKDT